MIFSLIPKVASQVLTDHVQHIISQLVRNFVDVADSFNVTRVSPVRHLNGDLRALILVNNAKNDHLTNGLLDALVVLRTKVQSVLKDQGETPPAKKTPDNQSAVSSAKKRLFEETKSENGPEPGCSSSNSKRSRSSSDPGTDEGKSPPPKPGTSQQADKEEEFPPRPLQDNSRLKETLSVFMKTLNILIQMCESAFFSDEDISEGEREPKKKKTTTIENPETSKGSKDAKTPPTSDDEDKRKSEVEKLK